MRTKQPESATKKAVLSELQKLANMRGGLTPEAVVSSAKQKHSPLHSYFVWDDTEAAARYRLIQAAQLIRTVKVTIIPTKNREVTVRAFINTREVARDGTINLGHKGKYTPINTVLSDKEKRRQMVEAAARELKAIRIKYSILSELDRVWSAIDRIAV